MPVSFDLFGTLLDVRDRPQPGDAIADSLLEFGVDVPADWSTAYRERHVSVEAGEELPIPEHVRGALRSRGVQVNETVAENAVVSAFEPAVETRPGAAAAVKAARRRGPVGICSNCAVPGLVERALEESSLDRTTFDGIVSSVDIGYRKPDRRAFEAIAGELGTPVEGLVHVGDDPHADGGIAAVGGRAILLSDHDLQDVPTLLGDR
ncbi:MAG: HAD family hydrolase [Natrialbaceae archaeon]